MNVLIAGCGYVGSVLAGLLAGRGHRVWGLKRNPVSLPEGVLPLRADLANPSLKSLVPPQLDVVVYAASADASDEDAYRRAYVEGLTNLLDALSGQSLRRVVFTSSTGVYAQQAGEEVDESSETTPQHFSGQILLEAERLLAVHPAPSTTVRLAGIYGPGRDRMVRAVAEGRARTPVTARYTNRIHRDDCAGVIAHLIGLEQADSLYVGVDDEPALLSDVQNHIATQFELPSPPEEDSSSPPRKTRSNKRCRNRKLKGSGYEFLYPTYREGYADLIRSVQRG